MDQKDLDKIKKILLKKKDGLAKELDSFGTRDSRAKDRENFNTDFPEFGDKDDENAAEVAAYSDRLAIEETLEKDLRDVNKSLERIEKGTYGICSYCKKAINPKRLAARPTSGSCVSCKKGFKGEK